MREEKFIARDGKRLVCTVWDKVSNPIGVVQIIHGMDEHVRRYDRFAKFLNMHGYIVFGDDHRGHGKTASAISKIGQPDGDKDMFAATVSDEMEIMKYLKRKYNLPVFLFGHSYGSFITQSIMQQTDIPAAGVCLSGSARYPEWILGLARGVAWMGRALWGADAPARLLELISPIRGKTNGTSRLTRDAHQAALHDADPLRAKYFSYGFYFSLFKNLMTLHQESKFPTPLLIISGARDMVSLNSRFSKSLYNAYQNHDMSNLTLIIYPDARHELLMELNHEEVQHDILQFFNSALKR